MGWRTRCCCPEFNWPGSKAIIVANDLLLPCYTFGWVRAISMTIYFYQSPLISVLTIFCYLNIIAEYFEQTFYTEVQARLSAICHSEAHLSRSYICILCQGKIWRWKFQSKRSISLCYNYLYSFILYGTICIGLVLCGMQGSTSAIQSRSKVYND